MCKKSHKIGTISSCEVKLGWSTSNSCHQLSNAVLIHRECLESAKGEFTFPSAEYGTGELEDDEFRTGE